MKLILVEDDEQDRHLIMAQISEVDKEITLVSASGLADAAKVIAKETPDVALLDLGLGPTSGLRTLLDFRKTHPSLPVVVMTGLDQADAGLEAIRRGADHYLVKGRDDGPSIVRAARAAAGLLDADAGRFHLFHGDDLPGVLKKRVTAARKGQAAMAIATVHSPADVLMQSHGDEDIFYVDASGQNIAAQHPRVTFIETPQRFEVIGVKLEYACRRLGPDTKAILYALDTLALYASQDQVTEFLHALANRFRSLGIDLEVIGTTGHPLIERVSVHATPSSK